LEITMKKLLCELTAATFALGICFPASAVDDQYRANKKQLEAEYKAAKANCKTMTGNERRDCLKTAKAEHERSEKMAKASHEITEAKRPEERAEAQKKAEKAAQ
jgi:hypothetical protein